MHDHPGGYFQTQWHEAINVTIHHIFSYSLILQLKIK
jgi:hypothetical protein